MNTIILFWNQANSSFGKELFRMNIEEIEEANESNSMYSELYFHDYRLYVNSSQRVGAGDRFFLICYGGKRNGICCSGYLASDYYQYEEQQKEGRLINDLDLIPDFIIHPDRHQILSVEILKESIPDIEWNNNNFGRFITKEQSIKIDNLWQNFLKKNSSIFDHWSVKQNYDFDFYLPQEDEYVSIRLTDDGKINAHNYRCDVDIICDDIDSAKEKAREIIEKKYGNSKHIKFDYYYGFSNNSDYIEKVLRIITETCKDVKDEVGKPYIEKVIKASQINTMDGPRILLMLLKLLEDGMITENDLREKKLPLTVLEAIHILYNSDNYPYETYIEKISENDEACNCMIDVLSDRLNIVYKYKEIKAEDFKNINKWLKAYHKLVDARRKVIIGD